MRTRPSGDQEVVMMRMAIAMAVVAASLLVTAGNAVATTVYWVPAHELAPQGGYYGNAASCDLDGDGDQDVSFLGMAPEQNAQFWNVGTGHVPAWQMEMGVLPALFGCWNRRSTYGDIDEDGDFDLVSGCTQRGLHLHRNTGTPQVPVWAYDPAPVQGVSNSASAEPCLADLDADGDLDLAIAYRGAPGVYLKMNIGTPQVPQWTQQGSSIPGVSAYPPIALGDLDLDGDLDLVGGGAQGLRCWENVGTPQAWSFTENPAMLTGVGGPGAYALIVVLLDVDGDGDLDLLVMDGYQNAYLFLNEQVSSAHRASWGVIKELYR
jgi:hypothetical protein